VHNQINRTFLFSTTLSSVQVKIKKKGEEVEQNTIAQFGKQNSDIVKMKKLKKE